MVAHSSDRARRNHKDDCLLLVPYASIIAALLCAVGVALFVVMMLWAFTATIEQTRRALDIESVPSLDKVQVCFVAVSVLMAISTVMLLIVGAMSTGSTRHEVYSGMRGECGGRVANGVAMAVAYVLNVAWLLCFACSAVLCFIYYVFNALCAPITSFSESTCLDFSLFKPITPSLSAQALRLCGGDVQQFCALSSSASAWYLVGLVGCMLTIKGLVHFLITCSANYAHVTSGSKYAHLTQMLTSEDFDGGMSEVRGFANEELPRAGSRWARPYSPYRH